jgi:hypothetical protein
MNMKDIFLVAVGIVVIVLALSWTRLFPASSPHVVISTDPSALPGTQIGDAPWQPELSRLFDRLYTIGVPALQSEGDVLHTHQHLDIYIHGKTIPIPSGIGVNERAGFISPLHTHDTSGVIHVESDRIRNFNLGEVFDVWGLRFDGKCIGSYCADKENPLLVYVNGLPVSGNPRDFILAPHQEIVVLYGTAAETPPIPTTYTFEAGL